jgi:hypothetical protein
MAGTRKRPSAKTNNSSEIKRHLAEAEKHLRRSAEEDTDIDKDLEELKSTLSRLKTISKRVR